MYFTFCIQSAPATVNIFWFSWRWVLPSDMLMDWLWNTLFIQACLCYYAFKESAGLWAFNLEFPLLGYGTGNEGMQPSGDAEIGNRQYNQRVQTVTIPLCHLRPPPPKYWHCPSLDYKTHHFILSPYVVWLNFFINHTVFLFFLVYQNFLSIFLGPISFYKKSYK